MTADNLFMCQVPATVNVHTADSNLAVADSHFFPNTSLCNLLIISITNPEQIARNVKT